MTASYYSGQLIPDSFTSAGGSDPDYPPSNLGIPRLARPCRSDGFVHLYATMDFGAPVYIESVVWCDLNTTAVEIYFGTTGALEFYQGEFPIAVNEITLRKHSIVPVAGSWRYITLRLRTTLFPSEPYGNCGAGYAYSKVTAIPRDPRNGFKMERLRPEFEKKLPNGVIQKLKTGTDYTKLAGSFKGTASDDLMGLLNAAQQETVFLDLDIANRPGLAWPIELDGNTVSRTIEKHNREVTPFALREVV